MSRWNESQIHKLADVITTSDLISIGAYKSHYEAYLDRKSPYGPKFYRDKKGKVFYVKQDIIDFINSSSLVSEKIEYMAKIRIMLVWWGIIMSITAFIFVLFLCSCTISFQIIDTHGTATDVVDDTQSPKNDVSPTIDIPVKP